ncbi:MAG: ATP-binding protein [Gammaproteobacteria bacterium]|nr:ATP-binding protein [Gammaproteobacteria bacterium]MDP2139609.1 ATP-binding protein [Gammaproteobacteria bacterium]MDP2346582.1 ATP-binding protein [Gammaproteobacteria bacterium]
MAAPVWYRDLLSTLKAQALLVLTGIFIVSHVLSLIIYEFNRHHTVILTEATDLADRIIGIVELAESFPDGDRVQILTAAQTQFLSMYPEVDPPLEGECQRNEFSDRITGRLVDWFSEYPGLDASVCVRSLNTPSSSGPPSSASGFDALVYIDFPDGERSIFHATLPDAPSLFSDIALAYIILVGLISLLIGWFLISRVLTPLGQLAHAADEIGVNIDAKALSEEGPSEVRRAAIAFNRMQSRLRRLVHGQTEMIAAISHDLRSATTRLQLRAEMLQDEHEREGLVRVVADMRLMIESVLDFIRGVDPTERPREADVIALLDSLCEDLKEEGYPVTLIAPDERALLACRPSALRRCFQNIIDNAIKYGDVANIECTVEDQMIVVAVQDQGPGVAEAELQNILRPFYRLEHSRNRDNGGVGLGLAIAQNIVQSHGGQLKISNPQGGGLRVEIRLPRTAA